VFLSWSKFLLEELFRTASSRWWNSQTRKLVNKEVLPQVWIQRGYWVLGKTQSVGTKPYKTLSSFASVVAYNDQFKCYSLWLMYHYFQPFPLILNFDILTTSLNEMNRSYILIPLPFPCQWCTLKLRNSTALVTENITKHYNHLIS